MHFVSQGLSVHLSVQPTIYQSVYAYTIVNVMKTLTL